MYRVRRYFEPGDKSRIDSTIYQLSLTPARINKQFLKYISVAVNTSINGFAFLSDLYEIQCRFELGRVRRYIEPGDTSRIDSTIYQLSLTPARINIQFFKIYFCCSQYFY